MALREVVNRKSAEAPATGAVELLDEAIKAAREFPNLSAEVRPHRGLQGPTCINTPVRGLPTSHYLISICQDLTRANALIAALTCEISM